MTAIHLDHLMVPSRNKVASAKLLAELLGVPWSETGVGALRARIRERWIDDTGTNRMAINGKC